MSQENVERVRESVDAINRRDVEAVLDRVHPDLEWQTLDEFPDARTYRGPDEVRGFFETWSEIFRGFRLHLEECIPVGDECVLASLRVAGKGAESGVEVQSPTFIQLLEFRDDRLIRSRMFRSKKEALEAAALSG